MSQERSPGTATRPLICPSSTESDEQPYLPAVLWEIKEVAGLRAALAVAGEKGGARAYIPARAPDDHWLTQCAGREAADKISAHFASGGRGSRLIIPRGPASQQGDLTRRIAAALDEGRNAADIARELGIHERTARRHRKRRGKKREPDLFDQLKK